MKSLTGSSVLLFIFLLFVIPSEARADTVVITGGSWTISGQGVAAYSYGLTGNGLAVSGSGSGGNVSAQICNPCHGGQQVSLSSFFGGTDIGSGSATINGTTYQNVFFGGAIRFVTASATLPSGNSDLVITTPFSLSDFSSGAATLVGYSDSARTNQLFTTNLDGQGIATFRLNFSGYDNNIPHYTFQSLSYQFTPVPEPMTLLLLATGLTGISAAVRRRRTSGAS
ncbi:MAG: PEP-CTERM sorting domain-containing protein [Acidobacteria bacterium]|nr:PEP-CTERM sorting domain-containing protein [Acidobacteriota bacterium]